MWALAPTNTLRRWAFSLLFLLLTACGGAFADAMQRGDDFAAAKLWDDAASAYQEALKLEPDNRDALIKLKQTKKEQATERLARAEALEQRGELVAALGLVQEAVDLDGKNPAAQHALTRMNRAALAKAQAFVEEGKLRRAFELTTAILQGSPNDIAAKQLDDEVRTALASDAFERGSKHAKNDRLGTALVEFAACLGYRPDYPDAKIAFGKVKLELEEQLRYHVVLERFGGKGKNGTLTGELSPDLVAQSIDERLLLKVVRTAPKGHAAGVRLHGSFTGYDFQSAKRERRTSCDYVCGTTDKPNPEKRALEQELGRMESDVARLETDVTRNEEEVTRYQKEVDGKRGAVDKAQADADEARRRYDDCMRSVDPKKSSPCSSEKNQLNSRESSLSSARSRISSPQGSLDRARSSLETTRRRLQSERQRKEEVNRRFRAAPDRIEVKKYCPFEYTIRLHNVSAALTMKLSIDAIDGGNVVLADEPFDYKSTASDEAFDAVPGRCQEVAQGNPLDLPSEKQLQGLLMNKVVRDVRAKVLASYDAYRQRYLSNARRHETAGQNEEAIEAYVRYVLTGPHNLDKKDQIEAFLNKTNGFGKLEALWSL